MAKVDNSGLLALQKSLRQAVSAEKRKAFYEDCCRELAARFLRKVIKRTTVGKGEFEVVRDGNGNVAKYKRGKRKGETKLRRLTNGGTLRRGWTAKTEDEAKHGAQVPVLTHVATLNVKAQGTKYTITVVNPVHYASCVEYGHKQEVGKFIPVLGKRLKASWVKGQFMATISAQELGQEAPAIISRKIKRYLQEVFNVGK